MPQTPADMLIDQKAEWDADEPKSPPADWDGVTPYATWSGILEIVEGVEIRCYVLNDGRRIFNADDVNEFFGEMLKQ